MDPEIGHLQHYRATCAIEYLADGKCEAIFRNKTVSDNRIHKFKRGVIYKADRVIKHLEL